MKTKPKSYYRKKCDRLLQEYGRKIYDKCEVCGGQYSCLHHYYTKACAGNLRYHWQNLIPICQGCHFRHHNGDPSIHNRINLIRGREWLEKLEHNKRLLVRKDNIGEYKKIIEQFESNLFNQ